MPDDTAFERIGPYVYRHFDPPRLPAQQQVGVAIVGGGPVGLATALGLARQGVSSVVIEADDSVCMGSRAACISRRSLEIVERLGASRAFLDKGLAWTSGTSYYGTEQVYRLEMPSSAGDKYPPMINLEQYYIEQFLLDQINALNRRQPGTIELRWQNDPALGDTVLFAPRVLFDGPTAAERAKIETQGDGLLCAYDRAGLRVRCLGLLKGERRITVRACLKVGSLCL